MAPYINKTDAASRLSTRYAITATLNDGDLEIASDEIDYSCGPFIGSKQNGSQARAFPRSINPDGTGNTNSAIPDAVLDATALLAYHLGVDEGPAVTSESSLDRSISYSTPKPAQNVTRVFTLLAPYQVPIGIRR